MTANFLGRARCPQRAGQRAEDRRRWLTRSSRRSEDTAPYLYSRRAVLLLAQRSATYAPRFLFQWSFRMLNRVV